MKDFETLTYEFYQVVEQIRHLTDLKCELEKQIINHPSVGMSDWEDSLESGVKNFEINEFAKLKIVRANKVKVDAEIANSLGLDCWREKIELDKRKFDALSDEEKALAESAITIEPAKPSVSILLK